MKTRKSFLWLAGVLAFGMAAQGFCGTFTVNNTEDSGSGSLRQAIVDANNHAGPDTVDFDLPQTGTLFNGTVWFIQPAADLPAIADGGTVIDGTTQAARRGDTNPDGPEVFLSGYQGRTGKPVSKGIAIESPGNVIRGLIVSCFGEAGILVKGGQASRNRIEGNFIGTGFSGHDTLDSPNGEGVRIQSGARHNTIGGASAGARNIISGNRNIGVSILQSDSNMVAGNFIGLDRTGSQVIGQTLYCVMVSDAKGNRIGGGLPGEGNVIASAGDAEVSLSGGKGTRNNTVQGNRIGTDFEGRYAAGSADCGVEVSNGASCNLIGGAQPGEANLISGHTGYGVYIFTSRTDSNRVIGNRIGIDANGGNAIPNGYGGVSVYNGPKANQIGPSNVIRFNPFGVFVQFDSTLYNRITQNSISDNANGGIVLLNNANGGMAAPSLARSVTGVQGTTVPNGVVEIFSDPAGQGKAYEGTTTADANGNFAWTGTPAGPFVTATAADAHGNTSPFSNPVAATGVEENDAVNPSGFYLCRNFPNPFNPETAIRFSVAEPCRVVLKVFDVRGSEVSTPADGKYNAGEHEVRFDASGLAAGIYFYRVRAGGFTAAGKMVFVK